MRGLPGLSATAATGLTGSRVRRALGAYGAHAVGSRAVAAGATGWDAAAIQFMLAWRGFPSATINGSFGSHVTQALEKFDVWAGLPVSDIAGPAVIAALQQPLPTCPIALRPPLDGPHGSGFGPRGSTFHTGVDYPAPVGTPVHAAAPGRVTWAGPMAGGWGIVETITHRDGVTTDVRAPVEGDRAGRPPRDDRAGDRSGRPDRESPSGRTCTSRFASATRQSTRSPG